MDTMKSTSPKGFWGEKKKKKKLLVFQITLRINQDCLNVEVATGCMWLIFQCTSEERVVRYLMERRHVLTSWWCSCHSVFTSLLSLQFRWMYSWLLPNWAGEAKDNDANLDFISRHAWEIVSFSHLLQQKLVFAATNFRFFHSHFHNLIPIFSSQCMYVFIQWWRIFMRPCYTIFWSKKKSECIFISMFSYFRLVNFNIIL